jgi:uncharacterized protein
MTEHLRLAGKPSEAQHDALEAMIREEPVLMEVLNGIQDLPDGMLVSGALYNLVWNRLSGRPPLNGIADIDVFYFDPRDLSYEAEDVVIQRLAGRFARLPLPVQVRNQARVHLWFEQKFGVPFGPLSSSAEMLGRYASKTHAVAARLEADGRMAIIAPFGLDDIFSFRIVPNHALANRPAHEKKAARAKSVWPETTVIPWGAA